MDLRIEKTHKALHYAFTSLLEEKKFEDFTVNELCERAMIRRTTFYKHFADKYEYFTYYVHEVSESFLVQLPSDANPNDLTTYYSYMSIQLLDFIEKNRKLVNHIIDSNMFPILYNLLTDYIRRELVLKMKTSDDYAGMDSQSREVLAAYYAGGLTNVFMLRLRGDLQIDETHILSIISTTFSKK